MVQATIDALKENPDIAPADSVACQQAAIKQYRAGQNTTVSSGSCRDAHQLKPVWYKKPRSAGAKQTSAFQFSIPFCAVGPCRIQT